MFVGHMDTRKRSPHTRRENGSDPSPRAILAIPGASTIHLSGEAHFIRTFVEGRKLGQRSIQRYTKRPPINCLVYLTTISSQYDNTRPKNNSLYRWPFEISRAQVLGSSVEGVHHIRILCVRLAPSEIAKNDMASGVEKDIPRFRTPIGRRVSTIEKVMVSTYRYTTSRSWWCSRANKGSEL